MVIYADEMCSSRSATCPSMVLWAGVIALYLEEMEQQAGELGEGTKKGVVCKNIVNISHVLMFWISKTEYLIILTFKQKQN